MRIVRVVVWRLDLPLARPYWLSGGRLRFDVLDSTFVRVDTDEGVSGWGEGCPWGHSYLPAHGVGVRAGLSLLAPAVMGCDPCAFDALNRRMDAVLPGHLYAKSAIDMACWDVFGKRTGMPLWRLLGSAEATAVAVNSSISTGAPEEMVASIREARAAGYRTHSAKIGGTDVAVDVARIEAIEAALMTGEQVTYDVNRAWTPGMAVQVLNGVTTRGWVEQPCETLGECAQVCRRVRQPIVLDECLHSYEDHLRAWRLGACEGIKLKPNRVGGLTKAKRLLDFAVAVGWRLHVEEVGGSALADTAAIHLAAACPQENRLASWLCHAHLAFDPVPGEGARNVDGYARPPDLPGVGVAPTEEVLGEAVAVYSAEEAA